MENQALSLRDELSKSFEEIVPEDAPVVSDPLAAEATGDAASADSEETPSNVAELPKTGRTAGRPRDASGKLLPGKPAAQAAGQSQPGDAQPAAAAPPVERPKRPDSWKKEFEEHWNTLDPKVANYIRQRESEYQSGVSTYKSEAESAKHLNEAIAPFLPNLQKHGIQPTQWIQNLGTYHERLALGNANEKAATLAHLMQSYNIDPQAVYQVLSQPAQPAQQFQQYQPSTPQVDIEKLLEEKLTQRDVMSELHRFEAEAPQNYPHYQEVKATMAGILQAGLAQDYKSAYETAMALPKHSPLMEAERQQREQTEAAERAKQSQAVVNRARSQAVSVKSSTPSGTMTQQAGNKSLRDELAANMEARLSSRV